MDQLTSAQVSEWEAYDRLDPLGTWREDFRLAYLCSVIANLTISVHAKDGAKHTVPMDFMLDWDLESKTGEPKQQSVEEMKQMFLGLARAHNRQFEINKRNNIPPRRLAESKTKGL